MQSRTDMNTQQDQIERMEAPAGDILGEGEVVIDAPLHKVFAFWSRLENLPQFMNHVKEVKAIAPSRYAWTVDAPLGATISWEAVTTRVIQNETISWQSAPDSEVVNSGSVHFSPTAQGGTRLKVKVAYTPPAGKLGHAVASLFGKNPEQQIGEDLERLRVLLSAKPTEAVVN